MVRLVSDHIIHEYAPGTVVQSEDVAQIAELVRRVRPLAEDFGLHHPRVKKVVLLADGGAWIEKR
jgi:hypothetical protein